ncbi:MAG: phosphomannomutase, partial [Candidatus Gracilibacteria bacterium]
VDEKGNLYSSDFMLLLLVRDLVKQIKKPKIVFDVKTSQVIINEIKKLGAIPVMSRVGHSFIERKMKEIGAKLGGEVSGHMFFGHGWYGFDDALLAAAKICQILSNSQTPLSQAFNDLPKTFTTPEFKAHCPDDKKFAIVKKLVSHFTELYDCLTIDGVRIKFDDATWAAVRASNTTPNLTLRFEADTRQKLADIQSIMVEELKKHPEVSLDWYSPTSS